MNRSGLGESASQNKQLTPFRIRYTLQLTLLVTSTALFRRAGTHITLALIQLSLIALILWEISSSRRRIRTNHGQTIHVAI